MKTIPLSETTKFIVDNRGRTAPTEEVGIPLIATNCISNNDLYPSYERLRYVSEETYKTWFRSHPVPGDIILTNKGSQNGAICLVPDPVDFVIAQDMVALRAKEEIIDPLFLFAALRSTGVQRQIKDLDVSGVIPHLKKGDFDKLHLPFPERDVQEHIGKIYFDFCQKIELNRRMNATLEAMASALFQSWFVDFDPVRRNAARLQNQPSPQPSPNGRGRSAAEGEGASGFDFLFPDSFEDSAMGEIPKGWQVAKVGDFIDRLPVGKKYDQKTVTSSGKVPVLDEMKSDLTAFKTEKLSLDKAITAMTTQIEKASEERNKKAAEIRELEKQTTSVQPTIDGINILLSSFGFQGFKLAIAAGGTSYKLLRADGSDAKATLSEGEKTFVTFLYFYHLLKGSKLDSGMTTDRIVVFDDPVSSLDSDIFFIVGSLIKGLFDEVRVGSGHIKQVFVLTHNVYFHKEVTYNPKRKDVAMNEETFWIIRKPGLISKLEKHPNNPIKTSYELLWAEVRKPERSNLAIQNTLRRILENYFKILGGIEFDQLCAMFEGKEKIICKSLCSWVHDGSHYAHDDLYISIDDSMVDSFLKVFRAIFDKSKHSAHYRMMMGDAFVEEPTTESESMPQPEMAV